MYDYVRIVEGQLQPEYIHEVFLWLAEGLTNFIATLRENSQEEAKRTDIAGFVRMQVRLNEV